jgi:hypothetical protein
MAPAVRRRLEKADQLANGVTSRPWNRKRPRLAADGPGETGAGARRPLNRSTSSVRRRRSTPSGRCRRRSCTAGRTWGDRHRGREQGRARGEAERALRTPRRRRASGRLRTRWPIPGRFRIDGGCAIVCAMVRNACKRRFFRNPRYKRLSRQTRSTRINRPMCRDFFERSGAGVEPTQPGAARLHRF